MSQENSVDGWKAIGDHLGVTARTAQRWHVARDLPVHRIPSPDGKRSLVFAYADELEAWRDQKPPPAESAKLQTSKLWLTASMFAILTVLSVFYLTRPRHGPIYSARVVNNGTTLEALDARGQTLWSRVFSQALGPMSQRAGNPPWVVVDLDGDAENELACLCPNEPDGVPGKYEENAIVLFDDAGTELWWYQGGDAINLDGTAYTNSFDMSLFGPGQLADGAQYLVSVATHRPYHPTQIVTLGKDGDVLGEYWNAGYAFDIETVDTDGDGNDELFFGGVNNDLGLRPALGHIAYDIEGGISPGPASYSPRLRQGLELGYAIFPLSATAEDLGIGSWVWSLALHGDQISVETHLTDTSNRFERVYMMNFGMDIVDLTLPVSFRGFLAERLSAGGTITPEMELERGRKLAHFKPPR